jgi:PPP family 3-phenylpropionic acid transporter
VSDDARRQLLSLAAYYLLSFGALGGFFPFVPIYLTNRGLSAQQVSWVMALVPLTSLLAPALWGLFADALRARTAVLRVATLGAAIGVATLLPARSLPALLAAMGVFCLFRAPLVALADAAAHTALGASRERFSRVRVWGSIGFALAALGVGALGGAKNPVFFIALNVGLYLLAAAVVRSPRDDDHGKPVEPTSATSNHETFAPRGLTREALSTARHAGLTLVLVATFVYYCGHATFDVFYSLHLKQLGFDDSFVGLAWAVGVVFEIAVMIAAPPTLARRRPSALLTVAALAAVGRWALISVATSSAALLAIQPLHGLTFGLWYLALVKLVQDRSPERLRATLQGLTITAVGLGQTVGFLGGGVVFDRPGGGSLLFALASGVTLLSALLYALGLRKTGFASHWPERSITSTLEERP